jgi:hypothetical protein
MGRPRINTFCTAPGCQRRAITHQLCPAHDMRRKKHGDVCADEPIKAQAKASTPAHLRIAANVTIDTVTQCWNWTGATSRGYGHLTFQGGGHPAHRVSFEAYRGPIAEGLVLDHLCRNTRCVNPDHLEPVTHRENIMRGIGIAPRNAAKTHCKHGHPLSGENLYQFPDGRRECRTCSREQKRRYKQRQRVA